MRSPSSYGGSDTGPGSPASGRDVYGSFAMGSSSSRPLPAQASAEQPQIDNRTLSLARKFIGRMNTENMRTTAADEGSGLQRSTFLMSITADHGGKQHTTDEYKKNVLRIGASYEDKAFDTIVRSKTLQIAGFSFLGLASMVVFSLYTWYIYTPENPENPIDAYTDDENVSVSVLNIMYLGQAIVTLSTITTCILIGQKYNLVLMQKRAEWSGVTIQELERHRGDAAVDTNRRQFFKTSYSFWRSTLKYRLFLEILVHILHPFVFLAKKEEINNVVDVEDIPNPIYKLLQLCMFLRVYLVADIMHLNSTYYINRFEIITAKPDLLKVGFNIQRNLSIKILFYQRPVRSLIVVAVLAMLMFGFMLFITERIEGVPIELFPARFDPTDSLWGAYQAFTTVGYGEISIQNTLGRMIAIICAAVGQISFIIFGAVLVSKMALSKEQKFGVEYLASREADKTYRLAAEGLIWTWLQVHLLPAVNKRVALRATSGAVLLGDGGDEDNEGEQYEGLSKSSLAKGHKGNRIYYATKKFRSARRNLEASFTQAEDEVINLKVTAVQELVDAVADEVDEHEKRVLEVEADLQRRLKGLSYKVARLREKGHIPV
jgi:hypothetical protein